MKWYADYLSIYDKPFTQAPQAVINQVKDKIRQLATHAPLVSVVAIAHNEEKRILSCLWSLCENQHNYPVEILVINNHSTDHTEEVLKELGVTYFNEYRKGPGFARQCGLNHARGKYHLCIDADTLYPPQYISTMIKVLQDKEVLTGYGTISADGSLFSSFKKRAIKGLRSFTALFYSKNNYEDENSNLIK